MYDAALVRRVAALSESRGIACQVKGKIGGGRDASEIQKRHAGVPVAALRIPTRYCRTASSVISEADRKATEALLCAVLAEDLNG